MYTISKDFPFSASHRLDGLAPDHQCARLHGHNYVARVTLSGTLTEPGFVLDYGDLDGFKKWLDAELDHRHLNDVCPSNPTAENLAAWMLDRLVDLIPLPPNVATVSVAVSETPKTWASYARHLR